MAKPDDEGMWQPTPSQAEGDRRPEDPQWQPQIQEPAEGGRDQIEEDLDGDE